MTTIHVTRLVTRPDDGDEAEVELAVSLSMGGEIADVRLVAIGQTEVAPCALPRWIGEQIDRQDLDEEVACRLRAREAGWA